MLSFGVLDVVEKSPLVTSGPGTASRGVAQGLPATGRAQQQADTLCSLCRTAWCGVARGNVCSNRLGVARQGSWSLYRQVTGSARGSSRSGRNLNKGGWCTAASCSATKDGICLVGVRRAVLATDPELPPAEAVFQIQKPL